MTHDELLAICDNYSFKDSAEPVKVLRAVVELHPMWTDYKYTETDKELVEFCGCCQEKYPCPTIQAIQKELQ